MSSPDDEKPTYLGVKDDEVQLRIPDTIQQHANANWKAYKRWYCTVYTKATGVVISKPAMQEMERILIRHDGHHPVNRAELCDDTLAILQTWDAVPLVVGTKDYTFAKARMIRDIIYEKLAGTPELKRAQPLMSHPLHILHRILPEDPSLAALNLTKGEISEAYLWIYRMRDGNFARHQAYRQPFSYPILARDGVTTLPANSSLDNDLSPECAGTNTLPRAPLSPLPANKSIAPTTRFHPYDRPQTMACPLFPPSTEGAQFTPVVEEPAPVQTSPCNEMTLDELVQEARAKAMEVVGYAEASRRGLLRPKVSRVQSSNSPGPVRHE
ncbi:MAG: hypothetical protein Q9178_007771 [Gyalolechia marmorata]